METKIIALVNNVAILASKGTEELVPVKPICDAIGILSHGQIEKIKKHPILNSVTQTACATGADGKEYEMTCLPLKFIFGWLFTINPDNVKEDAKEIVIKYQMECYHVLYNYFFGTQKRRQEWDSAEIELLEKFNDYNQKKAEYGNLANSTKRQIDKIREERLKNEPNLFD